MTLKGKHNEIKKLATIVKQFETTHPGKNDDRRNILAFDPSDELDFTTCQFIYVYCHSNILEVVDADHVGCISGDMVDMNIVSLIHLLIDSVLMVSVFLLGRNHDSTCSSNVRDGTYEANSNNFETKTKNDAFSSESYTDIELKFERIGEVTDAIQ